MVARRVALPGKTGAVSEKRKRLANATVRHSLQVVWDNAPGGLLQAVRQVWYLHCTGEGGKRWEFVRSPLGAVTMMNS